MSWTSRSNESVAVFKILITETRPVMRLEFAQSMTNDSNITDTVFAFRWISPLFKLALKQTELSCLGECETSVMKWLDDLLDDKVTVWGQLSVLLVSMTLFSKLMVTWRLLTVIGIYAYWRTNLFQLRHCNQYLHRIT